MGSFGVWRWACAAAAVVLWAAAAPGQSLWPEGGRSLFTDHRASAVGDLVTVVVNEVVAAQTQTKTSQARSLQLDLGGGSGFLSLLPGGGFQSGQDASANRAVGSTVAVQARVTLRDEPYKLRVTGVVRQLDVQADNTVPSDRLADVRIVLEGPRRPFTGNNPIQWVLDGFGALLRFLFSWLE
jgi:flagellar L-ring protein precursor FlgH